MIIAFKNNTLSKKFIALFITLTIIFLTGCQTIKKKSDEVAEKENEKFGQFVGKEVNEMRLELGSPSERFCQMNLEMKCLSTKQKIMEFL